MSWAEVYKINSDIQGEPLNFLNYLQDLKLNGSESYILYEGNHRIWEELYLNSLYLFSDRGIRGVVYAAFSETDIDNLFDKSTKLGEQLNAFYRTDIFSLGNADNVVKGMTVEHYNSLEQKFKDGYDRYVTREQEKATIGKWLNSTFSLDNADLEGFTTINDILANTEATNTILNNSNAIVALTMCKSSMVAVVANSNAMDLLGQYFLKVTAEPPVVRAILENNVIREAIIKSNEAMTQIATNTDSVIEILKNSDAVRLLQSNNLALETILTNEDIAKEIFPKILSLKTILTSINTCTTTIQSNIEASKTSINSVTYKNQTFPLLLEIKENYKSMENVKNLTMENITNTMFIIDNIINNLPIMRIIAKNALSINSIATNAPAVSAIANSYNAVTAFCESSAGINEIINNSTARNIILSNSTAMSVITSNSNAINVIVNNTTYMSEAINNSVAILAIANSSNAMKFVANNSSAMNLVVNNSNALDLIFARSNAMNEVAKVQNAVYRIALTPIALNKAIKSYTARSALVNNNPVLQANKSYIHTTITGNSSYFKEITKPTNSDGAPTQVIESYYIGVTYCYGYNGNSGYGIVYHGHNTSIEAGRGNGSKDETKKFITLGGTKYAESGDGYFNYSMYQAI
ncbi:phage tail protein [Clostridioides sp. ZZV14-6045]|uniref:phage tail protein n=1 Tax=Clostridioides sp. ZZV14-6045 TaxID=2811489 RepID=UPI001D1271E8|nr:phage tail protein [Clostridioides sp. ZZV14-6045]